MEVRWNSTYLMVERLLRLKLVYNRMTLEIMDFHQFNDLAVKLFNII